MHQVINNVLGELSRHDQTLHGTASSPSRSESSHFLTVALTVKGTLEINVRDLNRDTWMAIGD
jgi:hypothetical protein